MTKYVRECMTEKLITVNLSDTVAHAMKLMSHNRIHSVLIPREGRSWSIFTQTDLLIALDDGEDPNNISVGYYASPVKFTAKPDWDYKKALDVMVKNGIKHLPVLDGDGEVVGIISSKDIIDASSGE